MNRSDLEALAPDDERPRADPAAARVRRRRPTTFPIPTTAATTASPRCSRSSSARAGRCSTRSRATLERRSLSEPASPPSSPRRSASRSRASHRRRRRIDQRRPGGSELADGALGVREVRVADATAEEFAAEAAGLAWLAEPGGGAGPGGARGRRATRRGWRSSGSSPGPSRRPARQARPRARRDPRAGRRRLRGAPPPGAA